MTNEAVQAYLAAISNPSEETAAALAPHLADTVAVVGIVAPAAGKEAAIVALQSPTASKLLAGATWSEPQVNGSTFIVDATLPAGRPLGGLSVEVTLEGSGKIGRVGQTIQGAPPVTPSPIAITPAMTEVIDGALANGTPFTLSYVDAAGAPHLSLRGTVQVYGEQSLATWARDPHAGLPRAVGSNPRLSLLYRDPKTRTNYTFSGRARIVSDAAEREKVYAGCPEVERNLDGRKLGIAIVVDLDVVEGSDASGRINMRRG